MIFGSPGGNIDQRFRFLPNYFWSLLFYV